MLESIYQLSQSQRRQEPMVLNYSVTSEQVLELNVQPPALCTLLRSNCLPYSMWRLWSTRTLASLFGMNTGKVLLSKLFDIGRFDVFGGLKWTVIAGGYCIVPSFFWWRRQAECLLGSKSIASAGSNCVTGCNSCRLGNEIPQNRFCSALDWKLELHRQTRMSHVFLVLWQHL